VLRRKSAYAPLVHCAGTHVCHMSFVVTLHVLILRVRSALAELCALVDELGPSTSLHAEAVLNAAQVSHVLCCMAYTVHVLVHTCAHRH
jgi:hypothetical protein